VIPVREAVAPAEFRSAVRDPGLKWLREQKLDPDAPLPDGVTPPTYWRKCLRQQLL
jgi:hypothetical protein